MPTSTSSTPEWVEPAVQEVASGVFRVPLPLPTDALRAVNVYVLTGADGAVLIDGGWSIPQARERLESALSTLGLGLRDIKRFLVTHVHRDHYTLAVAIRRDFGTRVALGAGERESLAAAAIPGQIRFEPFLDALRRMDAASVIEDVTQIPTGARDYAINWQPPDQWLPDGQLHTEVGRTLEVVATPGHTRGHIVFYDRGAGLLFAGDHVLPTITPSIGFEPAPTANPLGQFLASLAEVRRRPDAMLLPAHGPVRPSVHARVDELLAHHDRRLTDTARALRAGAVTGLEVAGQLRWTRRNYRLRELNPYNQMLAVLETYAHLQLLVVQGRALSDETQPVFRFALTGV